MIKISPSLLAADFSALAKDVARIENSAELLHLDVMDGVFVPNMSFGQCVVGALRPHSKLIFDVHLMITDPIRYIKDFAKAGADIITIHYESCDNQIETLKAIRELGVKAAVSIKPATPAFVLEPLLEYVDMVLVMTVEPGFGGQSFIPETVESIKAVKAMIEASGRDIDIEVDGGITKDTIRAAYDAGANVFVAGSSVFRAEDAEAAIASLRAACEA